MTESHKKLPKLFWIQIALVVIVGILFIFAPSPPKESSAEADESLESQSVADNLKPVGKVAIHSASTDDAKKSRSGEEIFNGICGTCHKTGIANAPKLGDKAAWEPRVANGLKGLMETASKGKGAMPARGGDPSITDAELKNVIVYMTGKAGFDLNVPQKTSIPITIAKEKVEKVAQKVETETQEVVSKVKDNISNAAEAVEQKISDAVTTVESTVKTTAEKISGDAPAIIDAPVAPTPPTAPKLDSQVLESVANDSSLLKRGEGIYRKTCFACHDSGVAGSPKLSDKAAWQTRIATGIESLFNSALNGKGVMPAKGGNTGLADDDVRAAVEYMLAKSQNN